MRRAWSAIVLAIAFAGAAACSSAGNGTSPLDAQDAPETGPNVPEAEGGEPDDGGTSDSPSDAAPPHGRGEILGTLTSGACGVLLAELTKPTPSIENNILVFVAGESYDRDSLSPGGQVLFDSANAGGSSTESEIMSYEVLRYCEDAKFLKTETQISYQAPDDSGANTITDLLVEIGGKKVGVSVTRAYKPATQPLTDPDVKALLEKKLEGVNRSSQRVLPADKWVKQILHVFSVNKAATDAVGRVWPTIAAGTRADTIVLVTQTTGGGFVYCNPDPALGSECP